ncbi:hypothetical protein SAMN05518856_12281 [Paenibacillus sp. OK003]|nr:hypothetical protein SAMN05518856_12281 [Paenibacillus sp. OK003]
MGERKMGINGLQLILQYRMVQGMNYGKQDGIFDKKGD